MPRAGVNRSCLRGISKGGPTNRLTMSENHVWVSHHGATSNKCSTLFARIMSRITESSRTGGKAYSLVLGHSWASAFRPRGDRWDRANQSKQCVVMLEANRSTSVCPNFCHMRFTTWGWSLHSPSYSLCLESRSPGMWTTLIDRNFVWAQRRTLLTNLYRGRERSQFRNETTVMQSVLTNTWQPFNCSKNCLRFRKTAIRLLVVPTDLYANAAVSLTRFPALNILDGPPPSP